MARPVRRRPSRAIAGLALFVAALGWAQSPVDVGAYPSLQAAIDANPGRILRIPAGEYTIDSALVIGRSGTELHGPARITQTNPAEAMVRIAGAEGVRLVGLSFTRPEGRRQTTRSGIEVSDCRDVQLLGLHVSENHTQATIRFRNSRDVTVQGCTILNYKGPTIDDRRGGVHDYAFRSIDGTGIMMDGVQGGIIRDNRIAELRLRPTRETRDRHDLGTLTYVPPVRGRVMSQEIFDTRFTNNWHQGAAIKIGKPNPTQGFLITGNIIEHPAQGVDIHADNVIVTNNLISHAMTGIKTTHGARNVLIEGNQVTHADLRAVELHSGTSSRPSANAEDGKPAVGENLDGGTILANNIFSHFGFGDQYWNWPDPRPRNAISITAGPLPENPPIRDLLVMGNIVYDSGRDAVLLDGKWTVVPPRYHHAIFLEKDAPNSPVDVRIIGNLLHPGAQELPDGDRPAPAGR